MRARLAICIAVGTLALCFAGVALADVPTQDSPGDGAEFTANGSQISFTASTTALAPPAHMDFYISRDPDADANGVLANWFDHIRGYPIGSAAYQGASDQDAGWPSKPGTYYWQAVDPGCAPVLGDCASALRSLKVNQLPASAVTSPTQIETFLDKHPRHRTHKRRVKFAFSSNVEGAKFQCLFARGWAKCHSPHIFRHLKPGRYKFEARAVVNGLEDPTPASWTFKVRKRPSQSSG